MSERQKPAGTNHNYGLLLPPLSLGPFHHALSEPQRSFYKSLYLLQLVNNKRETMKTVKRAKNPFKEDHILRRLLQELDNVSTRRQFRRWRKSFMERYEDYLFESGNVKVRISYRNLCGILSRHVELVKKMHAHIQLGDLSPEGCTVRARQTLGNFFDQMIRVKQILIDLLPTTAQMERDIGYTKFHLAAVLIDNGFVAYDRLVLCDEIHFHFKKWCLQDVANKLFNLEMDHYRKQLDIFCDIMADLGISKIMRKALYLLHKDDDEETIEWGESLASLDSELSSESSDDGLDIDLDPMPDLSDITFEDDDDYILPLWKVNDFYKDNVDMAETFRKEMKRKSFEMFSGNSSDCKSSKPPGMPRRTFDIDDAMFSLMSSPIKPEVRIVENKAKSAPMKRPQRRLSNDNASAKPKETSSKGSSNKTQEHKSSDSFASALSIKPQRRQSNECAKAGSVANTQQRQSDRSFKTDTTCQRRQSNDSAKSTSRNSNSSYTRRTSELSDSDDTKEILEREGSESSGTSKSQKSESSRDNSVGETPSRLERFGVFQRQDTGRFLMPPTNFLATPSRMSKISGPAVEECESDEESDSDSDVSLSSSTSDDSKADAVARRKSMRSKSEPKKKKSFYSFNNYYHGNPSDWRISKSDH